MRSQKLILKKLKDKSLKKCAIIGHTSADPDAIAAAVGIDYILKTLHKQISVDILMDGISNPTKELISHFKINIQEDADENYDLIVIVDVNVPTQFGKFKDLVLNHKKEQLIIIDHHSRNEFSMNSVSLSLIEDERTSTAEMITELIFELNLKPDEEILTILLAGIIYDSRRFFKLNKKLLNILVKMFEIGVNYELANSLLQKDYDYSEKIARLKCASRLKLQKIHGYMIAWSRIGSHEGSSARAILDLGADVALIYSTRKNETRLNVRAKNYFYKETNLHFGKEIMNVLGELYQGDGGGHSTAAALNIPSQIKEEELRKKTLKLIEKQIKLNQEYVK